MKYIFSGTVHPERFPLTIERIKGELGADDSPFVGTIFVSIILSQVVVDLDTDDNLSTVDLKNTVETFVHTIVDVFGYLKGLAYTVEIRSVYLPSSFEYQVFGTDVVAISHDESNRPLGYSDTLQLALRHPTLYMALKDLRDAMKKPHDTSFHCRRAQEGIAKFFTTDSVSKNTDWESVKRNLKLTDSDIVKHSNQRHGIYSSVNGSDRIETMMKAWRFVDRFIEYLKEQE